MLSRIAAALLTGPIAFFVAGLVDLSAFALAVLGASVRKGLGSRRRNPARRGSDPWRS